MQYYYSVFYVSRHVFNIQRLEIVAPSAIDADEVIAIAKSAVKTAIGRSDTITAITGNFGTFINVGSSEFVWFGE